MAYPKIHYEEKSGLPAFGDIMYAIDGFESMNYEPQAFTLLAVGNGFEAGPDDVVIGSPVAIRKHFRHLGCEPEPVDYPNYISTDVMGRAVYSSTLGEVHWMLQKAGSSLFVKPKMTKKGYFDAKVYDLETIAELRKHHAADTEVFRSTPMTFLAEYRVFVHQGKIIDIRRYAGPYDSVTPEIGRIQVMMKQYVNPPIAYTLDVGIDTGLQTVLVEANDFWAIGAYGLDAVVYATMLRDRYHEIRQAVTKTLLFH